MFLDLGSYNCLYNFSKLYVQHVKSWTGWFSYDPPGKNFTEATLGGETHSAARPDDKALITDTKEL